jgi:hypothetical protein
LIRRGDGGGEAAGIVDFVEAVDPDELHEEQVRGFLVVERLHEMRVEGGDIRPGADADAGRDDDGAAIFCTRRRGEKAEQDEGGSQAGGHYWQQTEICRLGKGQPVATILAMTRDRLLTIMPFI